MSRKKPQVPMFVKDIHRMREALTIDASNRVRVILQSGEGKLGILLECFCCEELLEWAAKWWVCPVCGDQTTEDEAKDLLIACFEGLRLILEGPEEDVEEDDGVAVDEDEGTTKTDEGPRSGRWVDRVRWLMGI